MHLVDVDHNSMTAHLTRSDCEVFQEVLYIQRSGWDWWTWCGMAVKRMGMLGVSVRQMNALTQKIGDRETDW
jgi:hypothetical protein